MVEESQVKQKEERVGLLVTGGSAAFAAAGVPPSAAVRAKWAFVRKKRCSETQQHANVQQSQRVPAWRQLAPNLRRLRARTPQSCRRYGMFQAGRQHMLVDPPSSPARRHGQEKMAADLCCRAAADRLKGCSVGRERRRRGVIPEEVRTPATPAPRQQILRRC